MINIGLPKRLVILRHGESVHNEAKKGDVFYTDETVRDKMRDTPDYLIPLTDKGRTQAVEAGLAFKERFGIPDEVIHSGFLRTEETAAGFLSAFDDTERAGIKLDRDHRLRERDPGYCYNLTRMEVGRHFPWLERYWKETGSFFARPPGGESRGDVVNRLESKIMELYMGPADRTTVWVTHGITTICARFLIEDLTYAQLNPLRWPPNCGIVAYEFRDEKPILVVDNERLCRP